MSDHQTPKLQLAINNILHLLSFGSGIFFDVKMVKFMKNQNKTQPTELIPWKSVDSNKAQKDMEVPVRATIATAILTTMFLVLLVIYLSFNYFWELLIACNFSFIIPLPLILFFTIRHKKEEKNNSQPPTKLQFHNENFKRGISHPLQFHEDFDESLENSVEDTSNENVKIRGSSSLKQKEEIQQISPPKKVESLNASVSMKVKFASQNEMFDKIDVISITEVQC